MKKWKISAEYDSSKDVISQLLEARGIKEPAVIDEFINTPQLSYYAEKLEPDLKKALMSARSLIQNAIKKNIPITVHGDYDADGICATAILYNVLKKEMHYDNSFYYIPSRFENGYGLSKSSIDELGENLKDSGVDTSKGVLLITVDSGITANAETNYAKQLGYTVIITDHHQKPSILPDADCIVWSDKMVGSGISWFLSKVIGSKDKQSISFAAVATVTDLQPLLGINRAIVKKGLEVINKNPPLGLKKLMDVAGRTGEISAYELGWVIGPRINASGRLVRATEALKLFIEEDSSILDTIVKQLNETNVIRQDKTLQMFELASIPDPGDLPKVIFSVSTEYHEGIIGLVAAKLVQRYYRPSIVISLRDGLGKGSVRSIPGIDIIARLRKLEHLFENVGGHPMAAGFTINQANIEKLQKELKSLLDAELTENDFDRMLNVDLLLPANYIGVDLVDQLDKLKPFGLGNEEPVFATYSMGVVSCYTVGQNKQHLLLKLFEDGHYYKAIFFGEGTLVDSIGLGTKVDIAYTLKKNEYEGKVSVDMLVKDLIIKE
ncbi:single-stranded-DNA-specific exonuclease RecJ [candidate division WWE3 bacterium]|uniref:Single-stranded-DNA-specific exonuclease RecJ n=1 Tax=candidate division WWE3 bacterium TaxID=2053526 RepID=A0A7X9HGI2_UNCKA|nr:single-stranded-DNA-specific exonuclease RecJ [candidate division WWE3 bacterium]